MSTNSKTTESLNPQIGKSGNRSIRNQRIRESPNQRITQSSLASLRCAQIRCGFQLRLCQAKGKSNPQLKPSSGGGLKPPPQASFGIMSGIFGAFRAHARASLWKGSLCIVMVHCRVCEFPVQPRILLYASRARVSICSLLVAPNSAITRFAL
jgi:hypothetical protein